MTLLGLKRLSLVALAVVAFSCGGGDDDMPMIDTGVNNPDAPPSAPDATPSTVLVIACGGVTPDATISTTGFAFTPADVTISAGQVVQFAPTGPHNMTAGVPGSPTGDFATTTSMETCLRFTAAGDFPFYCSVHPTMLGSVTVQ